MQSAVTAPRLHFDLENARFAKAVVAAAGGVGGGAADDDVVEEIDFDGAGGVAEDARELDVGGARRRIAAGMVVRADDGGGGFANGGAEHFARMRERGGGSAGTDFDAAKETIFPIQAEHQLVI